jgi:hypothetical protein
MLGRFVCPAGRLAELGPYVGELFADGPPLAVSALGRGGDTPEELYFGLRADLEAVAGFRLHHGPRVAVDVFETRLPAAVDGTEISRLAEALWLERLEPFVEVSPGPGCPETVATLLRLRQTGFKLRCGGVEAAAFPPPVEVGMAIQACHALRVPLKFTAGLHHPVRHFNASVQTKMHGFLNVLVAGILGHARGPDCERLVKIITDEDPSSFHFDDHSLAWKDQRATVAEIESARKFVTSFGSCSFDEPRDDLRTLGLL